MDGETGLDWSSGMLGMFPLCRQSRADAVVFLLFVSLFVFAMRLDVSVDGVDPWAIVKDSGLNYT